MKNIVAARMDKLLPSGIRKVNEKALAMERAGVPAEHTAMLGDKLLTDVLGARRSGVLALMVEPLGGPVGPWNHVLHLLQRPFKAAARKRALDRSD